MCSKTRKSCKNIGLGYTVNTELGNDRLEFDCDQLLKFILKMHSLEKVAENTEVEICSTWDGSTFTNNASHVTRGMKVIDTRAIDPKTNDLLVNFQSRELSFVFECHLMKDTKEGHAFSSIF